MAEKRIMMGFKAPSDVKNTIDEISIQEDRTVSYTIVKLLRMGIEKYKEEIGTPSSKAQKVMDYIDSKNFTSFNDFFKIVIQENKYDWIDRDMGWHMAYLYVCADLNIEPDPNITAKLAEQDNFED